MYWKTHTVKMSIPSKMIQWDSVDSILSHSTFPIGLVNIAFVENDQLFLKFMWKCKRPRIAKAILKKAIVEVLPIRYKDLFKSTLIKIL